MKTRLLIGIPLVVVLVGLALYGPGWSHYLILLVMAGIAGQEAYGMLDRAGLPNFPVLGIFAGLLFMLMQIGGLDGDNLMIFLGVFVVVVCMRQILQGPDSQAFARIGGTLAGFFYVFFLMSFFIKILKGGTLEGTIGLSANLLSLFEGQLAHHHMLLLFVIVVTKCSDTGAYFTGRAIGRTKCAPRLSPGKTWEGCIGGVVFSMICGVGFAYTRSRYEMDGAEYFKFSPGFSMTMVQVVVISAVLGTASIFGDLAESLLKRSAKQKDSSTWLPGLGGVLDMLDSLLFTAPLFFVFQMVWL